MGLQLSKSGLANLFQNHSRVFPSIPGVFPTISRPFPGLFLEATRGNILRIQQPTNMQQPITGTFTTHNEQQALFSQMSCPKALLRFCTLFYMRKRFG